MKPAKSDARQALQDEAFKRLDELDIEALKSVSLVRIAALAATTVQYVDTWIATRGHTELRRPNRNHGKTRSK